MEITVFCGMVFDAVILSQHSIVFDMNGKANSVKITKNNRFEK